MIPGHMESSIRWLFKFLAFGSCCSRKIKMNNIKMFRWIDDWQPKAHKQQVQPVGLYVYPFLEIASARVLEQLYVF